MDEAVDLRKVATLSTTQVRLSKPMCDTVALILFETIHFADFVTQLLLFQISPLPKPKNFEISATLSAEGGKSQVLLK
jgi:hypothetical protein